MRIQRAKKSWAGVGVVAAMGLGHGGTALGQIGACCLGNGTCVDTTSAGCTTLSGEFVGSGTACATTVCLGACCTANKACVVNNRNFCIAAPGSFQGAGSTCELNCPSPLATAFTYQGQLKVGGVPVSDPVDLQCSLWTAAIGGTQVESTQSLPSVDVVNGLFTVTIDFGAQAFAGNTRWLQVAVRSPAWDGQGTPPPFVTLAPRQTLTTTPNAIRALNATTATNAAQLNGQPASFYQNASNLTSGVLPGGLLGGTYSGALTFSNAANSFTGLFAGDGAGLMGLNASNLSSGTLADARLSSNVALLGGVQTFTGAKTFSLAPLFTAAGAPFSVTSTTLVANLNADRLDGLDSSAFLQSIPVPLTLTGTTGGHIIRGENTSTVALSAGVTGYATAATGTTIGVRGQTYSTSGRGVFGYAGTGTGGNYGVYGQSDSVSGIGVYGRASAITGSIYGVYGQASTAAAGYAVYAAGDMGASGVKPFRIDHPDDPANKYLLHYAAESPEVINFYSGKATLDAAGGAVVELPHYFAKINKDPRYTLTAVGAPMPMLHVAEEIDEAALSAGATAGAGVAAPACTFRIAGGAPGGKVSWRVEALRNDLWVQNRAVAVETVANGVAVQTRAMPVEVEKQGVEKGTYQHPELYGQPPEKRMNYDATRAERGLQDRPHTERPQSPDTLSKALTP